MVRSRGFLPCQCFGAAVLGTLLDVFDKKAEKLSLKSDPCRVRHAPCIGFFLQKSAFKNIPLSFVTFNRETSVDRCAHKQEFRRNLPMCNVQIDVLFARLVLNPSVP